MRDPFKNRTNEDLAMQYVLLSGPHAPTKMYSAHDVMAELKRRLVENNVDDIGPIVIDILLDQARDILKMVNAHGDPNDSA